MIRYSEEEVLRRLTQIEENGSEYQDQAISFWWEVLRLFRLTGAKQLAFLVEAVESKGGDFPSCIYIYHGKNLISAIPTATYSYYYQEPVLAQC